MELMMIIKSYLHLLTKPYVFYRLAQYNKKIQTEYRTEKLYYSWTNLIRIKCFYIYKKYLKIFTE